MALPEAEAWKWNEKAAPSSRGRGVNGRWLSRASICSHWPSAAGLEGWQCACRLLQDWRDGVCMLIPAGLEGWGCVR